MSLNSLQTSWLRRAREQTGLSLREVARRAGTSHATLSAYEHGRKSPSLHTFLRIIDACDLAADVRYRPRIRERHGLPRGQELEQVLRLAAQFPARRAKMLKAPNMAQLMRRA